MERNLNQSETNWLKKVKQRESIAISFYYYLLGRGYEPTLKSVVDAVINH